MKAVMSSPTVVVTKLGLLLIKLDLTMVLLAIAGRIII